MNDDWRVRARLADGVRAAELAELMQRGELEHGLQSGAGDRVIVSVDDRDVFVYAGTREQSEAALEAIRAAAGRRGWSAEVELRRWHPEAEEWADPEAPLPATAEERAAEHAELVERERAESAAHGFGEWEVRVECASHRDTVRLSEQLEGEGVPSVRRWRYLLISAADEDSARMLADRLTAECPPGCTVTVEASLAAVAADTPANPFAVFGGLGL
jgi:hypothetical protein